MDLRPNPSSQQCTLNFFSGRTNTPLERFEKLGGFLSMIDLPKVYLSVLDRRESLARHLHVPLISTFIEERVNKIFTRSTPLSSQETGTGHSETLNWVDVVRDFDIDGNEPSRDGMHCCLIRERLIDIPEADYAKLRTGILQQMIEPLPIADDVGKELETITDVLADVKRCYREILEVTQCYRHLVTSLEDRYQEIRGTFFPESDGERLSPANTVSVGIVSDNGPDAQMHSVTQPCSVNSSHASGRGSHADGESYEPEVQSPDQSGKTDDRGLRSMGHSRWTSHEEASLLAWMKAREHLTWPEIEVAYFHEFGIARKQSAIRTKLYRLNAAGSNSFIRRTRRKRKLYQATASVIESGGADDSDSSGGEISTRSPQILPTKIIRLPVGKLPSRQIRPDCPAEAPEKRLSGPEISNNIGTSSDTEENTSGPTDMSSTTRSDLKSQASNSHPFSLRRLLE